MKQLYLLFTLFVGLSFTNCSNDDPEVPSIPEQEENKPVEKVDYYIKYIVKATSPYRFDDITVATDKGTQTFDFSNKSSWEQTYGPVAKGFRANIKVVGYTTSLEIHCCRGQEPFALKAIKSGRAENPSLSYTIDY